MWKALWDDKYASMASLCGRRCSKITAYGHKLGVKACKFVGTDVLLTGGVDRRLIAWRACDHFSFRGISSPFAGTVRAVDCDGEVLVTGSSDHRIRIWHRERDDGDGVEEEDEHSEDAISSTGATRGRERTFSPWHPRSDWNNGSFSLEDYVAFTYSASEQTAFVHTHHQPFHSHGLSSVTFPFGVSSNDDRLVLAGHGGPVSSVSLLSKSDCFVSGSWDYSVRLWSRWSSASDTPTTVQVVPFGDWVVDTAFSHATGDVLVASGSAVTVMDAGTGSLRRTDERKHKSAALDYPVTCIAPSVDGRTVFYAADGKIFGVDLRSGDGTLSASSSDINRLTEKRERERSLVTGMALEFPFVAFSLSNGQVGLINVEDGYSRAICGPGGIATSVDICEGRVAAGFDDGSTCVWEFR